MLFILFVHIKCLSESRSFMFYALYAFCSFCAFLCVKDNIFMCIKTSKRKKVAYLCFVLFMLFVCMKSFRKKQQTALIPSNILLLNSSHYYNIFQSSQFSSMIQYFSIITIFMKISPSINSII